MSPGRRACLRQESSADLSPTPRFSTQSPCVSATARGSRGARTALPCPHGDRTVSPPGGTHSLRGETDVSAGGALRGTGQPAQRVAVLGTWERGGSHLGVAHKLRAGGSRTREAGEPAVHGGPAGCRGQRARGYPRTYPVLTASVSPWARSACTVVSCPEPCPPGNVGPPPHTRGPTCLGMSTRWGPGGGPSPKPLHSIPSGPVVRDKGSLRNCWSPRGWKRLDRKSRGSQDRARRWGGSRSSVSALACTWGPQVSMMRVL